jgi:hypothetical protein
MDREKVMTDAQAAGVRLVRFLYVDNGGVIRGKLAHIDSLAGRLETGIGLTVAMQAMNMLDDLQPVEGMGPVIEKYRAPLVLLHAGWPFYRETAHLAALYPHVWLDLSLAIPFATAGIPAMLGEILGMTPISKVLFATDAFTMPEIYWLAARWGRWGLSRTLESFVSDGFLAQQEVRPAAQAILGGNARRLYN